MIIIMKGTLPRKETVSTYFNAFYEVKERPQNTNKFRLTYERIPRWRHRDLLVVKTDRRTGIKTGA